MVAVEAPVLAEVPELVQEQAQVPELVQELAQVPAQVEVQAVVQVLGLALVEARVLVHNYNQLSLC